MRRNGNNLQGRGLKGAAPRLAPSAAFRFDWARLKVRYALRSAEGGMVDVDTHLDIIEALTSALRDLDELSESILAAKGGDAVAD